MADKELPTILDTGLQGWLKSDGPIPEWNVDKILADRTIATLRLKGGGTPLDHALGARNPWLARKIAVAAQPESSPDYVMPAKPEAGPQKAETFAASLKKLDDNKQLTATEYKEARAQLEDSFLAKLDPKARTPETTTYLNHQILTAWRSENHKRLEKTGGTFLQAAAAQDRVDIIDLLVAENTRIRISQGGGADVPGFLNATTPTNQESVLIVAVKNNADKAFTRLLELGADPAYAIPQYKRPEASNAAHYAAANGRLDFIKQLKAKGGKIDEKSGYLDDYPIDIAVLAGHTDVVKFYLDELKATIKKPEELQARLDQALTRAQTPEMVELLVAANANPNSKAKPALHYLGYRSEDTLGIYGVPKIKLDTAGTYKKLIGHKADVEQSHALLYALGNDLDKAILHDMLDKTKDVKYKIPGQLGRTPLHVAVSRNNYDMIGAILKKDPKSANITDSFDDTPLADAIMFDKPKCVKLLVPHTDLNATYGKCRKTALTQAVNSLCGMSEQCGEERMTSALAMVKLVRTPENIHIVSETYGKPQTPFQRLHETMQPLRDKANNGLITPKEGILLHYIQQGESILHGSEATARQPKPDAPGSVLAQAIEAAKGITLNIPPAQVPPMRLPEKPVAQEAPLATLKVAAR